MSEPANPYAAPQVESPGPQSEFLSTSGLARAQVILLYVALATSLASALFCLGAWLHSELLLKRVLVTFALPMAIESVALMAVFFVHLFWVYRTHFNLKKFGAQGVWLPPIAAVASCVIPYINFVFPFVALNIAWKGSDPTWPADDGLAWKRVKFPTIIATTWFSSMVMIAVVVAAPKFLRMFLMTAGQIVVIPQLIAIIQGIERRQKARRAAMQGEA